MFIKKVVIRLAYRMKSGQSNSSCLTLESPRIQQMLSLRGWMSQQSRSGTEDSLGAVGLQSMLQSVKECLSSRIDGLGNEIEGKQAHSFLPPCSFVWAATRRCSPQSGWVLLLQLI